MIQSESITESVERFAALCAQLDDGMTSRALFLASVGLDERACDEMRHRWLPLLASGEDAELGVRFARAYARARQDLAGDRHDDADTERDGSARTELTSSGADQTLEMAIFQDGPALPFKPAAAGDTISRLVSRPLTEPTEPTLEVPCALPKVAALPFSPPLPTGRHQRLQRYDTQTGRPLAAPVWIDEPTPPSPRL